MAVRKCPKCGSVWYTALTKCAFCGVEGEEVKGPISPAKLNLGKKGVESGPPPGHSASDRDLASSASAKASEDKPAEPDVAVAELPKVEVPPPEPEPPKEVPVDPPKPEPTPVKIELPPPPPSFAPSGGATEGKPPPPPELVPTPRPERIRTAARIDSQTPAPLIPSATVPLVFGSLGLVAGVLLPLTTLVRHDKVLVTLSLLAWAILAPFAPFAWFTAQRYADRCRALGFSPASAAHTGKLLGMLASFLIVFEFSALAVFVAVQILSGKVVCPLWK